MSQVRLTAYDKQSVRNIRALAKALRPHADDRRISFSRGPWQEPVINFVRKGKEASVMIFLMEGFVMVGNSIITGDPTTSTPRILRELDKA